MMTNEILVVDDEHRIRKLLKLYLEREGYVIAEASDGREALDMATKYDYSCILLDLMLPEMDGLEVAVKLRELKDTPIIMLTAKARKIIALKVLNQVLMTTSLSHFHHAKLCCALKRYYVVQNLQKLNKMSRMPVI